MFNLLAVFLINEFLVALSINYYVFIVIFDMLYLLAEFLFNGCANL